MPSWIRWKIAEKVEQELKKGAKITLKGKLSQRSYEAKDGTKRYTTEIVVNEFELMQTEKLLAA